MSLSCFSNLTPKTKKVLLGFLAAILSFYVLSEHVLDADEGVILNQAWQMWHHKIMYVDFYEYTSPGSGLMVFYLWKLLGAPSFLAAKLLAISLYLVSSLGVYLIAFKLGRKYYLAMGAAAFWLAANLYYPVLNYNTQSSYAAVWLFCFLLLALEQNRKTYYVLAGAAAALLFWILYTKGLILLCFSLLAIFLFSGPLKKRISNALYFLAPFFALTVSLHRQWSWETLYRAYVIFPQSISYLSNTSFSWTVIFFELLVMSALSVWLYLNPKKENWLLLFFQAGLFLSFFYNIDRGHFMINSFPFWIFLVLAFEKSVEHFKDRLPEDKDFKFFMLFFSFAFFFVYSSSSAGRGYLSLIKVDILKQPRKGIFAVKELQASKHIYSGPFMPGLYFEFRKENPFTEINSLALCDDACMSKTLRIMEEVRPEFCLLNYRMVRKYNYNKDNPVDNYIRANYKKCPGLKTGRIEIYARDACPKGGS